jgi:hypothetical protein
MKKLSKPKSKLLNLNDVPSRLRTAGGVRPMTKLMTNRVRTVKAVAEYAVHAKHIDGDVRSRTSTTRHPRSQP